MLPPVVEPVRHRDWLLTVHGIDTDAWIHPPLIRFLAGYLDQGLAHWAMPEKRRGIHGCFLDLFDTRLSAQCGRWARTLPRLVADDRAAGRTALDSIENSLTELGITADDGADYLRAELL
ncbi:MAG TPA: putative inorganic carbon transporter subunit DabA, partial [Vicinamibacterales bacterium]|nr:putative inorganic carbon transporter subunit DabA [Vicinamibacterales bacterium]